MKAAAGSDLRMSSGVMKLLTLPSWSASLGEESFTVQSPSTTYYRGAKKEEKVSKRFKRFNRQK